FTPSYSYELRSNSSLPTDLPKLVGVGGRYGKMPEYNQAFGMSPVAASVTVVANPSKNAVSLTASVKNNSGASIKKVDFYIGTTLVGSATSSPYTVNVSDVSGGTYSAIAVATDANGLEGVSTYMTFNVSGEHVPTVGTLTKNGAGSSNQRITLGESIVAFSYVWGNSEGVTVTGLPNGVSYSINESENRVSISGTPTEAGEYVYTIVTVGADSNASVVRTISVIDPNAPASSSSGEESTTFGNRSLNIATEAETSLYRIFDMQGRPLFVGGHKPAKMPAARVVVVEYTKNGALKRRYIQ
ncbi:Ig-like domain-containing protein, partial [uncultured Fibrobacter sp.]|uniref:Ig-like domain-containing protein n=1 Tax=uncultured Fibrobacter sp. TaxID=261512 RepID=UPI00345C533F